MNDIIEVFNHYISQCGSIDIAESEFKMAMNEDQKLKKLYRQWCHDVGSSEKTASLTTVMSTLTDRTMSGVH